MDFRTVMETRHSCRSYQNKPVEREDLIKIVEAGRLTPSGCNAQPWKFIVVDEPEALDRVRDALVVTGGGTGCPWRDQVPAFIILCETPARVMPVVLAHYNDSQRFAQGDIGAAAMNMCYQAMELGLDTCILGLNDQEKMQQHFGIPDGYPVRLILAVGYGVEHSIPTKARKPMEEICSFNHW